MSKTVKVLVLTGDGVNCERETARAFELSGAETTILHVNQLTDKFNFLDGFQILALPGGFSFGDELGSGKVFSLKLEAFLGESISKFIERGCPVIGICNGFQVLTKLNIFSKKKNTVGLARNNHGTFINKWSNLKVKENTSLWLKGIEELFLPIRHGEGRFVFNNDTEARDEFLKNGQVVLTYGENPNGSTDDIAGVCDPTGRVLGLMPHPEAAVKAELYPGGEIIGTHGLQIFMNAVNYVKDNDHV